MALERNPQDSELVNAVFRAFHTVKGGAGFLQLPALVELCHAAEDVLNAVRGQRRAFDDEVMDAVLQAVDAAQRMMAELYANAPLVPASPELLMQLRSEEHTSELQSLMRISYAVFCLKKKKKNKKQ